MARGLKGSFFDSSSSTDDGEVISDSSVDSSILNIPMGDQEDDNYEEEEEEEEQPQRKVKSKSHQREEELEEEEEEEEFEEEQEEEETEEEEEEEEDDLTPINRVALDLIDKGVLEIDETKEYENSEIGFAEMIEDTVEARLKAKVPEDYNSILDAIELGIPASEWAANVTPVAFEDADLTDEDTQRYLITESLKLQGLSKNDIEKKLGRYEKLDTLAEEAEEAQALLVKNEAKRVSEYNNEVKQVAESNRKKQEDFIKSINDTIDSIKELNGEYLDRKKQRELKDYINKPVNAKGQTQYMIDRNDPKKLIQIAHLAKSGINIEKISKQLESKVTKTIKDKLDSRNDNQTSGKGKQVKERIASNKMSGGMPWDRQIEIED